MGIKIDRKQTVFNGESPVHSQKVERVERPFESYIQNNQEIGEGVYALLGQIEQQGERLAQSLTVKDLRAYKQLVQQFIRGAVGGGVTLKQNRVWHRPDSHAHSILQVVDQTLIKLTDEVLKRDVNQVAILKHLGEIKGLLVDLYR